MFIWQPANRYAKRLWALVVLGLIVLFTAYELTGRPNPVGVSLGCWGWVIAFAVGQLAVTRLIESFKPDGDVAPAAARSREGPAPGAVAGLTAWEEALRSCSGSPGSTAEVVPDIESDLLAATRKSCKAAPGDPILAVLDFSGGEGDAALLFGCEGLYWRNGPGTGHPGPGPITYADMLGRRFVNHGDVVYLGNGQFICPNEEETGVGAEELTGLLFKVCAVLEGEVTPRPPLTDRGSRTSGSAGCPRRRRRGGPCCPPPCRAAGRTGPAPCPCRRCRTGTCPPA